METNNQQAKPKTLKIDAYVCPELHILLTEKVDEGKQPMRISCIQCGQPAISLAYNVNQNFVATMEWYRPTEAEMQIEMLKMKTPEFNRFKEFIIKGGLLARPKQVLKKEGE